MAKILVIDDEAVIREPIAESLRAHGYNVCCAGDGRTALATVKSGLPDMILLDIRMPDQDGISLLREFRALPGGATVPVILLSSSTDKAVILQAASLGVQGYIIKSAFSLKEVLERIKRLLDAATTQDSPAAPSPLRSSIIATPPPVPPFRTTVKGRITSRTSEKALRATATTADQSPPNPATWPKILTRDQTLERLDHVASGKTLAGVVAQLISVANSPQADLSDVVRVIQSDPILAARVLQLASSASVGSRARVRNVEDAARNVGVRAIQNMAISIGIVGAFPPDERDGFNTMRCWQHSYAVAELLNRLTREQNPEQESMNHLIGLCHDLGEILVRQHFPSEYEQILQFAFTNRLSPHEVQSVALGIRQPELVSRLLVRIGLPPPVVQAIREFYERQIRDQSAGNSAGTKALELANLAAHGLLLAASSHEQVRPMTRVEWRQFSARSQAPTLNPVSMRNEILSATSILARLPANEEQRLLVPPIPRHTKRIWYIRPEMFVAFDPLAYALTLICDLVISPVLPNGDQWKEIDGLVLVGIRAGVMPIVPEELARIAATANCAKLPMLALVAEETTETTVGSLLLRSYPISLEDLGLWIAKSGVGKSDQSQAWN
jgi:HD-like signal output (HDOD) protein/DNA-binding response OmpR family regulator